MYNETILQYLLQSLSTDLKIPATFEYPDDRITHLDRLESHLNITHQIPDLQLRRLKNNDHAKDARAKGNSLFLKASPSATYQALELYNESICYAESGSEELSIGYANRSAVYFKWKMFEECLQNIELAQATEGYPRRLDQKLLERKDLCDLALITTTAHPEQNNEHQFKFKPTLSHPPNLEIPFVSSALRLQEDGKYGRFISTNTALQPGQVLAIEESDFIVLDTPQLYTRCINCLAENQLNLIPCPQCTCAMFCSQNCLTSARNTFHGFECSIIDYILTVFNYNQLMAIRLTIKAFLCFRTTTELIRFINEFGDIRSTAFNTLKGADLTSEQTVLHYLYSLESNEIKYADDVGAYLFAAVAYHQLIQNTRFSALCVSTLEKRALMELLLRFLHIAACNSYGLFDIDSDVMKYSSGVFPFCSLLNHSCAPNVANFNYGTKMIIVALRPIRSGEQLFANYGPHHYFDELYERQAMLRTNYFIECCDCIACQYDYPLFDDLPVRNTYIPSFEVLCDDRKISEFDEAYLIKAIYVACQYLQEHDAQYPDWQICGMHQLYKKYFNILLGNVALKTRKNT